MYIEENTGHRSKKAGSAGFTKGWDFRVRDADVYSDLQVVAAYAAPASNGRT